MNLDDIEIIKEHKDLMFGRIKIEYGYIYVIKNLVAMTSSFVPDSQTMSLESSIKSVFDKLPSYKAGEMPLVYDKPINDWISIKDKLPDANQIVLIFNPHDYTLKIRICQYSNWSHYSDRITHWQPLPEPPI